jgi:hypothetical protein
MVGKVEESKRTANGVPSAGRYSGRTGIVFFRNFWGPGSQGDHIDLWNGNRMTHGEVTYFRRAQSVWFWPVR